MPFNSLDFLLFFPLVVCFYYKLRHKHRWIFLLTASYIFYMWWRAEYVLLIVFCTLVSYFGALCIHLSDKRRIKKLVLYLSLTANLIPLFVFKYYSFFRKELFGLLEGIGIVHQTELPPILLPVGISFFTFQTLAYMIDVYNGRMKPEKHLGRFAVFVSFFPQLVAGPIERASNLIPQFKKSIRFDYERVVQGLRLILWGLFMKVVIADRLAVYVDQVYGNSTHHHGLAVILATYFFSFQIYCDFAGYSSIAIGAARVMGIGLITNFNYPYFSFSVSEFWTRWHISLTSWFRDYLYVPLGGNRVHLPKWYFNIMITFLVSGLWHGANWTFLAWGGIHGVYYLIEKALTFSGKYFLNGRFEIGINLTLKRSIRMLVVFNLVAFSWIFFRSNSVSQAVSMIHTILTDTHISRNQGLQAGLSMTELAVTLSCLLIFIICETLRRFQLIPHISVWNKGLRWAAYYTILIAILVLGEYGDHQFIYFQF